VVATVAASAAASSVAAASATVAGIGVVAARRSAGGRETGRGRRVALNSERIVSVPSSFAAETSVSGVGFKLMTRQRTPSVPQVGPALSTDFGAARSRAAAGPVAAAARVRRDVHGRRDGVHAAGRGGPGEERRGKVHP
jgi:hypothetical protein